ncbi:MAG: hypothetical protein EBT92_11495 [Planctomycetes bacterium]|nr:hypothetical protein [Planctomycetota bacterium]NBY01907.1 hypothetical protein [Planctomycetota bacterium]NDE00138.1 hypothetical protein [bacterium]
MLRSYPRNTAWQKAGIKTKERHGLFFCHGISLNNLGYNKGMETSKNNSISNSRYWYIASLLLLILLGLYFCYLSAKWYWQRSALNEISTIQESLQSEKAKDWPKEKRTIAQERIQYLEKGLDKESKKELTDRNTRAGLKKVELEFDRILHLDQKEKIIELDIWIDREEKSRQDRENQQALLRRQGKAISSKKEGGFLNNQDLSNLLDVTTPELRAKFHQLVKEINQRRQGRNLPPWNPFGSE